MIYSEELHIDSPEEELKRADHLVFVSLKYTRTCDVMRNAIVRFTNAFEMGINEYLEHQRKIKKIPEVPASIKEKVELIKKILGSKMKKHLILYQTLKKIALAQHCDIDEFRKNVIGSRNIFDIIGKCQSKKYRDIWFAITFEESPDITLD